MVLYAYVCGCAFSLRRESPDRILGDKPLLFQGGSVTDKYNAWGAKSICCMILRNLTTLTPMSYLLNYI
jgi:hypothetical protein